MPSFILMALLLLQHFPWLDRDNPAKTRIVEHEGYCMTADQTLSAASPEPVFTFDFLPPGASGKVQIDGKTVQTFKAEQHLRVHADVPKGDHRFNLSLDQPATLTFMVSSDHFKYCRR